MQESLYIYTEEIRLAWGEGLSPRQGDNRQAPSPTISIKQRDNCLKFPEYYFEVNQGP
jgi:hypothetical protein